MWVGVGWGQEGDWLEIMIFCFLDFNLGFVNFTRVTYRLNSDYFAGVIEEIKASYLFIHGRDVQNIVSF